MSKTFTNEEIWKMHRQVMEDVKSSHTPRTDQVVFMQRELGEDITKPGFRDLVDLCRKLELEIEDLKAGR